MPTFLKLNSPIYQVEEAKAIAPYGFSPIVHSVFDIEFNAGYIPGGRMLLLKLVDRLIPDEIITLLFRDYSRTQNGPGQLHVSQYFEGHDHPYEVSRFFRSEEKITWGIYPALGALKNKYGFIQLGVLWVAGQDVLPRIVPNSLRGLYGSLVDQSYSIRQ